MTQKLDLAARPELGILAERAFSYVCARTAQLYPLTWNKFNLQKAAECVRKTTICRAEREAACVLAFGV